MDTVHAKYSNKTVNFSNAKFSKSLQLLFIFCVVCYMPHFVFILMDRYLVDTKVINACTRAALLDSQLQCYIITHIEFKQQIQQSRQANNIHSHITSYAFMLWCEFVYA